MNTHQGPPQSAEAARPPAEACSPAAGRRSASARAADELCLAARFAAYAQDHRDNLPAVLDEACRVAAAGLEVVFAKLLVFQTDEQAFLLQAGVGWGEGVVGETWFDADISTAAGFAWRRGEAVISNDFRSETRFRPPDLLVEYGIRRCINVVVPGDGAAPFGVLEAESPEVGEFGEHDTQFLQLLAHAIAAARWAGRSARAGDGDVHVEE